MSKLTKKQKMELEIRRILPNYRWELRGMMARTEREISYNASAKMVEEAIDKDTISMKVCHGRICIQLRDDLLLEQIKYD